MRRSRIMATVCVALALLAATAPVSASEKVPTEPLASRLFHATSRPTASLFVPEGSLVLRHAFTGARTNATFVVSVTHCSNLGASTAMLEIHCFDFNAQQVGALLFALDAVNTATVACRTQGANSGVYAEDFHIDLTSDLNQGLIQVLADSTDVLCSAQVLDTGFPPTFVVNLGRVP